MDDHPAVAAVLERGDTLSQNPNAPDHFTIFHRNHIRFLWRVLVLRG